MRKSGGGSDQYCCVNSGSSACIHPDAVRVNVHGDDQQKALPYAFTIVMESVREC